MTIGNILTTLAPELLKPLLKEHLSLLPSLLIQLNHLENHQMATLHILDVIEHLCKVDVELNLTDTDSFKQLIRQNAGFVYIEMMQNNQNE